MASIGNFLHRTVVFGCMGFGVYGLVVIGQNFYVKRQRLREFDESSKTPAEPVSASN
ncbi:hypothetical protein CC85DRAFT_329635 [Cutaneotrichosporon oleaginosum]|uniref:Cytochrome c oxidase assembly protein COX14 n=1 Tax=Cutaneotrichosporon oleaginosum TaxID=879819 RepID=A0A0J0XI22_9TREE|nr:uncharacterized protein CC85DRAFT_329635 [Cutaneotrichosporon oleaginosum]KLT40751.1 hypothetical protein CC85DRAFT_329635 [Cutaneotrichosporon oleaginosum]TXT06793.1 hypothetical protein COLE_06124 [Cutaneotrichosporon oleaginosum]